MDFNARALLSVGNVEVVHPNRLFWIELTTIEK